MHKWCRGYCSVDVLYTDDVEGVCIVDGWTDCVDVEGVCYEDGLCTEAEDGLTCCGDVEGVILWMFGMYMFRMVGLVVLMKKASALWMHSAHNLWMLEACGWIQNGMACLSINGLMYELQMMQQIVSLKFWSQLKVTINTI